MKGFSFFEVMLLLLLLSVFGRAASLECYKCSASTNLEKCVSKDTCLEGQKRTYFGQVVFDLGCSDKQTCGEFAKGQNAAEGMKVSNDQKHNCHECCYTDNCNRDLCEYENPSLCVDDATADCAFLNSVFDICTNINQAKKYCANFCNLCDVVDGNWSPWSLWSQCDVTCDNGTSTRRRSCSDPAPQNGGLDCQGNATEVKPCYRELCPVHGGWAQWMQWDSCSATCDIGMQKRSRICTDPLPSRFGDHCFGDSQEHKLCFPGPCANGGWSDWQAWSNCSSLFDCGASFRNRSRTCSNPEPSPRGSYCPGNSIEISTCEKKCPSDCYDIKLSQTRPRSGVYTVQLWQSDRKAKVNCDMDTDEGGWTVFQYRYDGSEDFYRTFSEYEQGFGDLNKEFWLGLSYIQEIANQGESDLRIDLEAADSSRAFETFASFSLTQGRNYTLHVGPTIDSLNISSLYLFGPYYNGSKFSTFDHDVDSWYSNCAVSHHGAWWYKDCSYGNLNGPYLTPGTQDVKGMTYYSFLSYLSLKSSKMMMRRKHRKK